MRELERQWTGITDGGRLGQWMLLRILSIVNPARLYWTLALVVPFYMLLNRKEYRAINEYFRMRHGYSAWKSFCKTYRNHFIFGQCMLDKFAVYAGKKDFLKIKISREEHAEQCVHAGKGVIVATSHVGNFELISYLSQMNLVADKNPFHLFQQQNRNLHVMMYSGETEAIMEGRKQSVAKNNVVVMQESGSIAQLFNLRENLLKGDVVNVTCDRFASGSKRVTCRFLNSQADFPISTFALAVHCDVPVLSIFCMKESRKCYHVYFKMLDAGAEANLNSREKVKNYAQSYAQSIEEMLQKYPEQWFNFYKFWR